MFFNEFEKYQMMKFHQEEMESKFHQEWKWDLHKKETLHQKVIKRWKKKSDVKVPKTIGSCSCQC